MSSYTRGVNIQNNTIGNLFTKKTKAKEVAEYMKFSNAYTNPEYIRNCFHYIHQNPLKCRLVKDLRNSPYSSWPDYYGLRNGTLCNKELTFLAGKFDSNNLDPSRKIIVDDEMIKKIW